MNSLWQIGNGGKRHRIETKIGDQPTEKHIRYIEKVKEEFTSKKTCKLYYHVKVANTHTQTPFVFTDQT